MLLLLFEGCRPNDHIWNPVAGFDGTQLVHHHPHRAVVGSPQREKQQRLWGEKEQGVAIRCLRRDFPPVLCTFVSGSSSSSRAPLSVSTKVSKRARCCMLGPRELRLKMTLNLYNNRNPVISKGTDPYDKRKKYGVTNV